MPRPITGKSSPDEGIGRVIMVVAAETGVMDATDDAAAVAAVSAVKRRRDRLGLVIEASGQGCGCANGRDDACVSSIIIGEAVRHHRRKRLDQHGF